MEISNNVNAMSRIMETVAYTANKIAQPEKNVNIERELARLSELEVAYSANAKTITMADQMNKSTIDIMA
jgi:flagellar hook-associated protein FlgK